MKIKLYIVDKQLYILAMTTSGLLALRSDGFLVTSINASLFSLVG